MTEEKILVVDDETSIRNVAQRALTLAGYSVSTAASGDEAVAACSQQHFTLVLTDLKMPGMNGEELLHRIKNISPPTEVIIITAYPTLESAISTLKAGAYDYLLKPFRLTDLEKVVQHCFEKQRLKRELDVERQLRQELEELNRLNVQLYQEGEQKRAELQRLSAELYKAQENERRRIARDLHDGIAQLLSGVLMHIDLLDNSMKDVSLSLRAHVGQIKTLTEQVLDEVRGLVRTLRPTALDDLGLPDALRGLVTNLSRNTRLHFALHIDERLPLLSSTVATTFYRIAQEALSNVLQHARASTVSIHLESRNGVVQLTVADDGRGISSASQFATAQNRRGIGLWSMRERIEEIGGMFALHSSPETGTTIIVTIKSTEEEEVTE